jgi:hypothetical protein
LLYRIKHRRSALWKYTAIKHKEMTNIMNFIFLPLWDVLKINKVPYPPKYKMLYSSNSLIRKSEGHKNRKQNFIKEFYNMTSFQPPSRWLAVNTSIFFAIIYLLLHKKNYNICLVHLLIRGCDTKFLVTTKTCSLVACFKPRSLNDIIFLRPSIHVLSRDGYLDSKDGCRYQRSQAKDYQSHAIFALNVSSPRPTNKCYGYEVATFVKIYW